MAAITILRVLDAGMREGVDLDDSCGFVPAAWCPFLIENGRVDRRIWEISLALAESRDHVSFWNLIYDDRRWQESRLEAYRHLDLPTDPQVFLDRIATALDQAARGAATGLLRNGFAAVQNDRLKLERPDALTIPRAVIGFMTPSLITLQRLPWSFRRVRRPCPAPRSKLIRPSATAISRPLPDELAENLEILSGYYNEQI
jgi:hypothetical protein